MVLKMGYIDCKTTIGDKIHLGINERVNFIGGESATGKTLLINSIKNIVKNPIVVSESNVDISRFIVIDDELNLSVLNEVKDGSIVFIDRYDIYSENAIKKIEKKMQEVKAAWLIMSNYPRLSAGLGATFRSALTLKVSKRNKERIFETESKIFDL